MKIWVLTSSYPRAPDESINAGVAVREVALYLRDLGHAVTVVTPDKPGSVRFDPGVEGLVFPWLRPSLALADLRPLHPVDAARAASLLASGVRAVRRAARESPPDGMIAVWGLPSGMLARAAARVCGAPYCVWLLGSDVWRAPELPGGVRALRNVIGDSVGAFANSSDLCDRATTLTGQDVEYLPSMRRLPEGERATPTSDLTYVGRLHPNKGPDILVEALGIAAGWGYRPVTSIYGSGDMEAQLVSQVHTLGLDGHTFLRGPIAASPLAKTLRSSRCLVIPSRIDSTPLVLGDAIQARVPVVVTDVGDTGSLVRRYRLGTVVAPEDPSALAEAIVELMECSDAYADADWDGATEAMSPNAAVHRFLEAIRSG